MTVAVVEWRLFLEGHARFISQGVGTMCPKFFPGLLHMPTGYDAATIFSRVINLHNGEYLQGCQRPGTKTFLMHDLFEIGNLLMCYFVP